jgi:hypothetical protein
MLFNKMNFLKFVSVQVFFNSKQATKTISDKTKELSQKEAFRTE